MLRLALRVRRADAEVVLAELLELAPAGVEERDVSPDVVEYAIYGAEGELPALPDLRAAAGGALVDVATTTVGDDWAQRWREFHRPLRIGPLLLRAPWHDAGPEPQVVIDPGQAFGTGAHPTTRLCVELLLRLEPRGALADLGCGSGVLAIAAAKLGWDPVLGCDHDAAAVRATSANAAANGVAVAAERRDLRRDPVPHAPTLTANLLRPLLLELCARMQRAPDVLVASGLLAAEADGVAAAFAARHGLREAERVSSDGWTALLLYAGRRTP